MTTNEKFVQRARFRLRLSREAFGDKLGLGRHSIWRYETGRWPVPEKVRLAINQLLAQERRK